VVQRHISVVFFGACANTERARNVSVDGETRAAYACITFQGTHASPFRARMHHLSGHAAAHVSPSLPVTVPAAVAVVAVAVAVVVALVVVVAGVGVSVGCGNRGPSDAAVSSVLTERRARSGDLSLIIGLAPSLVALVAPPLVAPPLLPLLSPLLLLRGGGTLFAMSAKSFIEPYCRESPRELAGSRKESMSSSVSVVVESAERGGGVGTNEAAEPPPPSAASAALHRGGGGGITPGRRGDGSGAPPGNAGAVIGRAPHMLP
jgi:hypothetical protein